MIIQKLFSFFDGKIIDFNLEFYLKFNRSFRFGDGIFETIRVQNGELLFFNDHISRFKKGISLLKFEIDIQNIKKNVENEIRKIILENNIINSKIRIQLFRDGEGLYIPEKNNALLLIEFLPLPNDYTFFDIDKKIIVGISKESFVSNTIFSGLKTCNALPYIIAGVEKKSRNEDELIILNDKGFISECIASNIFWIEQNEIYTPALSCACLEGVMRKNIINIFDSNDIEVNEVKQNFSLIKLNEAIFFTSNVFGIKIISKIEDFYTLAEKNFKEFKKTKAFELLQSFN